MKLLLTGATGAAGLEILRAALADNTISQVTVLSRRPLPPHIPASPKANVIIHNDFLSYPPTLINQISDHDACIWALGRASRGMNEADYTKLTYGYPLEAAKAINASGHWSAEKPFRFVHISGEGADSEAKSMIMFSRVKGKAERDLLELASKSGGAFIAQNIRPAYFAPVDPEDLKLTRADESPFIRAFSGIFTTIFPSMAIPIKQLAKVTVEVAKGTYGNDTLFRNVAMTKMGERWSKEEL